MKSIFHSAASRGHADHGWLNAKHSFSFASWHNPERVHFGMLRVLNDDIVAGGMGFGKHPHDNMEIITIPLAGSIQHEDSMGFSEVIHSGEVQVMSAGSGIYHSEYNPSPNEELNLFQIWIFPNQKQVTPRYAQRKYELQIGAFTALVGPEQSGIATWIHQDAWLSMGVFDTDTTISYTIKHPNNGAYIMLIDGSIQIGEQILQQKDAIGISDSAQIEIKVQQKSKILVIEVPMN